MRVLLGASALAAALVLPVVSALPALAQQPSAGNLEKLGDFRDPGTPEMAHIPQTGPKAEAIKKSLAKIKLPRGFKIGLYALVPDARHIAVGPQGIVTFVGTRKSKVWSVTDRDKDRVADEVKEFAPSIHVRDSERRVLLQGRLPVHRRAEPRARVPGRRVLLRRAGCCGVQRREAGRTDSAGGGVLQSHGAHLPHRTG